jgi:uncharacterized repeat protein (TIGR01451 family)
VSFEANQGQTESQVKYLSRGGSYNFFLTADGAVFEVARSKREGLQKKLQELDVLRMRVLGARQGTAISGEGELAAKSNYFTGRNSQDWHTNVPKFRSVRYRGIYPGTDLVFYGNQRQLEYDFVVSAGADPGKIALAFDGAPVRVNENGELVLSMGSSEIRFRKPIAYQQDASGKVPVEAAFALEGNAVGFRLGAYDRSRPLVIDPSLVYSTFLGGGFTDYAGGIAVDASGNAYVVGSTLSPGFPVTTGVFQPHCGTDTYCNLGTVQDPYDAFITKMDPTGATEVYSTFMGGENDDQGMAIAVDTNGNAYVAGYTLSCQFPVTAGSYKTSFPNCGAGGAAANFVAKINSTATALVYSTFIGVNNTNQGHGIAIDAAGNAYTTGYSTDNGYPTTSNAYQPSAPNPSDGKLVFTELNAAGNGLIYSTYLAGVTTGNFGTGNAIALDKSNNAYITGHTDAADFPVTTGVYQNTNAGGFDAVVVKFNPTASGKASLIYSTYVGGGEFDRGNGIAVDPKGNVYVAGMTDSGNFPTSANAFETTCPGGCSGFANGFVTALNSTASQLIYSTYLAGTANGSDTSLEGNWALALDGQNNAYVTGASVATDYPTINAVQSANGGGADVIVTELNSTGTAALMSTYLGGTMDDGGTGIAVSTKGNVYITGSTGSPNFPTTQGAFATTCGSDSQCNGTTDAFVSQISAVQTDGYVKVTASPNPVKSGAVLTYTITVGNNGPDVAAGVKVSDSVPTGTTFSSVSISSGTCTSPKIGGTGNVSCTIPQLAKGKTVTETMKVQVTAKSGAQVKDTVTIQLSTADRNKQNNTASVTVSVD